ncbi:serine threonine- kinase BLUS1-like [Olea europaea subsp. europaea]|uniref:Serine threonine- kinase BLUS1-like n=1 Tax=Olea europaea subsp. europaea TaxID=158383 RepID=A0A8S0PGZ6_OLEEU|nr:serine threonine- kinase BLUS1-like [Olea europaea subsp. europaea]
MDEWANVPLEGASSTQDDNDENRCIVVFEAATRNRYSTMCRIGTASGLTVYRCAYIAGDFNVYSRIGIHDVFFSLKLVEVNQQEAFNKLNQEVERNCLLPHHENLMGITKSFVDNEKLCVVFPYMDMGSLRSITAAKFPEGLPEQCIVVSLREILSGLSIIHANGLVHKEINAGHVFFSSKPEIKLGYSATIYEHEPEYGSVQASSSSVLPSYSICEWAAAPEVYNTQNHSKASDIWMIGITALELAYGDLRLRDRDSFEDMVRTICRNKSLPKKEQNDNPNPNKWKKILGFLKRMIPLCAVQGMYNEREFSEDFEKMVVKCLNWDAEKRPSANELLRYEIFNRSRNIYFFRNEINSRGRIL